MNIYNGMGMMLVTRSALGVGEKTFFLDRRELLFYTT